MMACDICGKTGTPLADLLSSYQTPDIKAICPGCEKIVNRRHGKLRELTSNILITLLKRFLNERKAQRVKAPND